MVCHSLLGKVGDMHLYCLHDRNVVINNAWRPGIILGRIADEFYHGGLIHCQIGEQHLIALLDILVAAGFDDETMEGHIGRNHAVIVLADDAVGKLAGKPVKLIYGAGIGALTGAIVKHGVDKDFQDRVRNLLSSDDSAAVFMVVDEMTTDKFIDAIRPFGGDVLQTSLSVKDEDELKHALFKN